MPGVAEIQRGEGMSKLTKEEGRRGKMRKDTRSDRDRERERERAREGRCREGKDKREPEEGAVIAESYPNPR